MKFGETITIGEDDLWIVEVDSNGHSQFFGPCNRKEADKVALLHFSSYKRVSLHYLTLPRYLWSEE